MVKMNKEEFKEEIEKVGLNLTEEQLNQFSSYCDFLLKYNMHTNLTAIRNTEDVYLKHFFDSATIMKIIDLNKVNTVVDVGTGAGFPGVVLKILFPHLNVVLLDSNNKKITFLKELIELLNLKNITPIKSRAEEFCQQNRENFDLVVARAVADLSILAELCLPLVKKGGYFLSMKGNKEQETKESEYAINVLGGKIEEINKFKLPKEESIRTIIKTKKITATPEKYPRRYEKIIKNPLKK